MTSTGTPARRATDALPPGRILIVDDSRAIRAVLARTLVNAGYEVLQAPDGQAGIEVSLAEHPDLVLLDIDMPVLNGLDTLSQMKQDPRLCDLPVIFLTAHVGGADVAQGLTMGARDYLRKPCEPLELLARVATTLRLRTLELALAAQARSAEQLSVSDPLTGIGNRRRFEVAVEQLLDARGAQVTVGLILADIDHFKAVNDTAGHSAGDDVLRIVAGRLTRAVGEAGTVVRWGGEEFLALLPDADAESLAERAEAMRQRLAVFPAALASGTTIPVTISLGCALGKLADLTAVLEAADAAMYRAKALGRNRVECHGRVNPGS